MSYILLILSTSFRSQERSFFHAVWADDRICAVRSARMWHEYGLKIQTPAPTDLVVTKTSFTSMVQNMRSLNKSAFRGCCSFVFFSTIADSCQKDGSLKCVECHIVLLPQSFNFCWLIDNRAVHLNLVLCSCCLPAVHEKFFVVFMVTSLLYELLTLFVFKWAHPALSDKPHVSVLKPSQLYFVVVRKMWKFAYFAVRSPSICITARDNEASLPWSTKCFRMHILLRITCHLYDPVRMYVPCRLIHYQAGYCMRRSILDIVFRPYNMHCIRCDLLLQMSHVAWFVCLFVCLSVCVLVL